MDGSSLTGGEGCSASGEAIRALAVGPRFELRDVPRSPSEHRSRTLIEASKSRMRGEGPLAAAPPAVWSAAGLRCLGGIQLGSSEVLYAFVWLDEQLLARDEAVLDDEERARSRRFLRPVDRRRFVVCHAAIRVVLARCLDIRPEAVRYERGDAGKPRLAAGLGPLEFSLSHSGAVGLLAVTRDRPVGVDVEHVRDLPDPLMIAEQHFVTAEADALRSLPPEVRHAAFFRCWTHKEALIKATGEGLSRPLDSFELDMSDSMATLKRFDGLPGDRSGWSLRELRSPPGFVAAGAVGSAPGAPPPRWRALERAHATRSG